MHVRTRWKLFQRAKMWPTTYPVRLASPALRDLDRIPPRYAGADPGGSSTRFCRRTRPRRLLNNACVLERVVEWVREDLGCAGI